MSNIVPNILQSTEVSDSEVFVSCVSDLSLHFLPADQPACGDQARVTKIYIDYVLEYVSLHADNASEKCFDADVSKLRCTEIQL